MKLSPNDSQTRSFLDFPSSVCYLLPGPQIFLPRPKESQVSETFLDLANFSTVAINVTVPNISLVLKLDPSENLTLQLLLGFQSYPNQSHHIAMTSLPQQGATLGTHPPPL